ncbi:YheC/YheD family protein [Paenibacillus sp. NEAU-GSW1]|uniref:YheC/YheD family protein n=1 Tax=Paenibacillus sp. NEAU-GSW1 TaxID=2682486 RepID=UPI0012E321A9|nr:YheC/YheD family protein [Paenibacillus sp. NEAU-GSW1]MUT67804.1 YheC/YheD family protein [Paenibacillus sp. NEAU-GSW1]
MTGILTKKQYRKASSKWSKTKILSRKKTIRRYIPSAKRYGKSALNTMLTRYSIVYVKPVRGSHGNGVMRVMRIGAHYSAQIGAAIVKSSTLAGLHALLSKRIGKRPYMIQRGISLRRFRGAIFDLRIVTQLRRSRRWQVTGMLARVAKPGMAVTNGAQGASIHTVETVLKAYSGIRSIAGTKERLRQLCLSSAYHLQQSYPFLKELGFDIALDAKLKPWILEVNVRPEAIPFSRLADKTMYKRILSYRRANKY